MTTFIGKRVYRILSLDGGGSKGVYTLGVLTELEAMFGVKMAEHFDLIYGTSTGAIIGAQLALGSSVATVKNLYFDLIPKVMKHKRKSSRSRALKTEIEQVFGERKFDAFFTDVGIVSSNYERERPMIFKTSAGQAHQGKQTFLPGFGCRISEALMASAAAFPFFTRQLVATTDQGTPELMDGGYVANNPTLFAYADAIGNLRIPASDIRCVSVGVGHYQEPQKRFYSQVLLNWFPFKMMNKQFALNTNTIDILRSLFFKDVCCVRIDDEYSDPQYATDLLESRPEMLNKLFVLGRESFRKHEPEMKKYMEN